jgi:hypothetical protein
MRMDQRAARRLERFGPIAVLVGLPCLLVFSSVGPGEMLFGVDMVQGSAYIRALVGRELAEGRVASWDPYAMCGFPLMAALQAGVFYPLTWPVLFLSPGSFWTFTALAHLILAGLFTFGWLRKGLGLSPGAALVGALVSLLSAYLLTHTHAGHISQISAHPWIAALLWRTERLLHRATPRRWILLAWTTAFLILPGFPQSVFFGGLLLLLRLAVHVLRTRDGRRERLKTSAAALGATVLGGLLAAPQLLPALELIPHTQRVSINTYEFATTFSLPPENLVTLLLPWFFGDGKGLPYWGHGFYWEISGFVGLGTLALAAIGLGGRHPQRWLWASVAGVAIFLALGHHTPLFKLFYYGVPGASLFRAPGRYLALFTLAASALAAFGVDRWAKEEPGVQRAARNVGLGAVGLLAVLLLFLAVLSLGGGSESAIWKGILDAQQVGLDTALPQMRQVIRGFDERSWSWARVSLLVAALSLAAVATGLVAYARGWIRARTGVACVGLVVALELLVSGGRLLKGHPVNALPWPAEFVEMVKSRPGGPYRIAKPGMRHPEHVGKCQLAQLHHVGGYESMLLRNYAELLSAVEGRPAGAATVTVTISKPHPVFDMLGVRFWMVPESSRTPSAWTKVGAVDDAQVFEAPGAFPRAFLVPDAVVIPDRDERLRFLTNPSSDLRKTVVLEAGTAASPGGDPGTASVLSQAPGRYEIAAETGSGAWLVLTESDYPGWEARVDGTPAEILRANHLVQAVRVPPGRHTVRFEYRSRRLAAGVWLFLLAAVLPPGVALIRRRRAAAARVL